MKIIKTKIKCHYDIWDILVHRQGSMSDYGSPHLQYEEENCILEFALSTRVVNSNYFNAYDII